ncbi:MAG: class I SAM-dependent methyltransferase [Ruminococcaceae bacterium]|nr:class I SAM-dependent methyltransferase [Oscillospiraceae bacterium]
MSLKAKFKSNASAPKGLLGRILLMRMNIGTHFRLAEWGLGFLNFKSDDRTLDIGCGGGANVRKMTSLCPEGKAYGIDCSEVSVGKSRSHNRRSIRNGKCEILLADAGELPFDSGYFDIVTAFETVYFWQDIRKAFSEVFRVLKNGGSFAVIQETEGRGGSAEKTAEIIKDIKFYTASEIKELMLAAGFSETAQHSSPEGWFTVVGVK